MLDRKKIRGDGELAAVLLGRGGMAAIREGAEESLPFAVGRSLLPSAMMGAEQGTGGSLPAALDRRSHRRPPGGGGASSRPPTDVQCHRMAPRVTLSWLRTERQCVREPDQDFSFSLSPLSSLSLLMLPSPVLSPRLSIPPGTAAAVIGPPGEGGRGSRRSLGGTPRPARGDGGMWRAGRGRGPWEDGARSVA